MSLLAVIPARGGSKRIPRKNLRPMLDLPLIVYTIRAALDADLFARVVVSTDDEEIADVATAHGAEAPFLREAPLADDHTPVSAVTLDALARLDPTGARFDHVAQLMPNCPLRTAADVRASFVAFSTQPRAAQISVARFGGLNAWWALTHGSGDRLEPIFPEAWQRRSQDLPTLFCPSGAIWWARAHALRHHGTFHIAERAAWEIPWRHAVDIDDEDDWSLAEMLMRARCGRP